MRRNLGATCVSCCLAVAGFAAVGVGGYTTFTGKSLCSLIHGCDGKETAARAVVNASNKESGETKSGGCCAMAALAKAKGCSSSEASVTNAAAKAEGGCSAAMAAERTSAKAAQCPYAAAMAKMETSSFVVMGAAYPIVMPAAFYDAEKSFCTESLVSAGCTGSKASSGCCKGKAEATVSKDGGDTSGGKPATDGAQQPEKAGEPVASR